MSFFNKLLKKITGEKSGPSEKTKASTQLIEKTIDEAYIENLEEELIRSDLGVKLSLEFTDLLRKEYQSGRIKEEKDIQASLKNFLLKAFKNIDKDLLEYKFEDEKLNIMLVVGVNGVGKTTSIGKLAHKFKQAGKKVLIAAGDTFRAAAEEQLKIWAQRAEVDICQLEDGAKSSTVVFKAIEKAKTEGHELLIIDTAGRLQNKKDLMDELTKLKAVIEKNLDKKDYKLETMLVLDASTGSNALMQAEKFNEATKLDGIILSKFDGSARGGMVFSLAYNFKLAVKFTGIGEGLEDIEDFNIENFSKKYFT